MVAVEKEDGSRRTAARPPMSGRAALDDMVRAVPTVEVVAAVGRVRPCAARRQWLWSRGARRGGGEEGRQETRWSLVALLRGFFFRNYDDGRVADRNR